MPHDPDRFKTKTKSHELVIEGDQSLTDHISSPSILVKGSLQLTGSMRSTIDDITVDGSLHINGSLTAQSEFIVNGKVLVSDSCSADSIIVNGSLQCPVLQGKSIHVLSITNDLSELQADHDIFILYKKIAKPNEPITLKAPEITIRYSAMYSHLMDIPHKFLKMFKKEKKFKKEILLENLILECDTLTIETLRIPDDVSFVFTEKEKITAKNILVKRFKINAPNDY